MRRRWGSRRGLRVAAASGGSRSRCRSRRRARGLTRFRARRGGGPGSRARPSCACARPLRRRRRRPRRRGPAGAAGRPGWRGTGGGRRAPSQAVDQRQRGRRAVDLGDRDRPVQRDHRGRGQREQVVVEGDDLAPVGRRARCARPGSRPGPGTGRAGRGAGTAGRGPGPPRPGRRPTGSRSCSASGTSVPSGAVRAGRRDSTSSMSPSSPSTSGSSGISSASRRPSRIPSAHSRRGPARRPPSRCAPGEDQIEHREHGRQPVGQVGLVRDAVRDARLADLVLGADHPLRDRRFGHEEQAGDLGGRQPAEQPQGQGDLRRRPERGVAAGEDQAEAVVAHGTLLQRVRRGRAGGRPRPAGRPATTRGGAGRSPGCGPW